MCLDCVCYSLLWWSCFLSNSNISAIFYEKMLDLMTKKSRIKAIAFATPVAEVTVLLDSVLRKCTNEQW